MPRTILVRLLVQIAKNYLEVLMGKGDSSGTELVTWILGIDVSGGTVVKQGLGVHTGICSPKSIVA